MDVPKPTPTAAPIRQTLADAIRGAIASGEFAPGSRLNERLLCEQFDVSRTVVRETLRQLEAEGFVRLEANRGAVVSTVSYTDAEALFELRGALESLACELFARRGTVEQKRELGRALKEAEAAMASGSIEEILVAKDRYYDALLDGAANPELSSSLRLLHVRIQMLRRHSLSAPGRHAKSLAEITEIYAAIVAGDIEGARRAGVHHVEQARYAALPRIFADEWGTPRPDPGCGSTALAREPRQVPTANP
jgi:DNA-binding GntR family transcriptional regulator